MLDKLDVRVSWSAPFSKEFAHIVDELRGDPQAKVFRPSQHYSASADLRPFGFSSIVHLHNKHGKGGQDHKLEIVDSGRMNIGEIKSECERVFNTDPAQLEAMRVDLAADVERVPVTWFHSRLRAQYKQFAAKIGKEIIELEYSEMGRRELQTLYYGKRPNCFRIYNKTAEYLHQFKMAKRASKGDNSGQSFDEIYGIPSTFTLTRVERQIGGGRVPDKLATVQTIQENAAEFNPFDRLKLSSAGRPVPDAGDYRFETYQTGMRMRELAEEKGLQWVRQMVWSRCGSNADRTWKKYADFMPAEDGDGITEQTLFEKYQESVSKQLAN